jgi:hypothetical protein
LCGDKEAKPASYILTITFSAIKIMQHFKCGTSLTQKTRYAAWSSANKLPGLWDAISYSTSSDYGLEIV